MQRSFGSSPRGNDEAVCLVDTVESHVPEKDDGCNVDIQNRRASNASEPTLQIRARANGDFSHPTKLGRRERLLSNRLWSGRQLCNCKP